jgi:hypothetical protein
MLTKFFLKKEKERKTKIETNKKEKQDSKTRKTSLKPHKGFPNQWRKSICGPNILERYMLRM